MATLAQIKAELNISTLELNTATDTEGNKTAWMRHWDNNQRISVSIHTDLVNELKSNPKVTGLGLQTETRKGEQGDYTSHRIVKYTPAEVTL